MFQKVKLGGNKVVTYVEAAQWLARPLDIDGKGISFCNYTEKKKAKKPCQKHLETYRENII